MGSISFTTMPWIKWKKLQGRIWQECIYIRQISECDLVKYGSYNNNNKIKI
jgi:hypothetical protein